MPFISWTPRTLFEQYYFILGIAALVIAACVFLVSRRVGLAFSAVRDDPILAVSQGFRPNGIRLIAFGTAAVLSTLAGVFAAHFQTVVCPDIMSPAYTIILLIIAFVGGRGSFRGILLAAVIFTIAPQILRMANEWRLVVFGLLLLVTVLTVPDGIERLLSQLIGRLKGKEPQTVPAPLYVGASAGSLQPGTARVPAEPIRGGTLSVASLTKSFGGVTAVDKVSFDVTSGELVGLIGPNGSGKSTTLDCISGLIRPNDGSVLLNGEDVTGASSNGLAKKGLVRTFQATRVFTSLTVRENLAIAAHGRISTVEEWKRYLQGQSESPEFRAKADDLIASLNLQHVQHRLAGELSYGQRKLVQFAAALIVDPTVLLLDEPLSGVNPTVITMFKERILDLNARGLTILLVEHNLPVVTELCRRLIVLDQGAVIADGNPHEVMSQAKVQEAYLGR